MAILEVKDLTLRFGGLEVIDRLSFEVEEGGIVSLIGPNGAGKTSVFNCLTGFYRPSGGDIRFKGESVTSLKPHRITERGMARTFQNLRLFKKMTVLENVQSGMHCRTGEGALGALLRNPGQRREEQRIRHAAEECLAFVGILEHKDRLARNLPYGDQRRVEWARALAAGLREGGRHRLRPEDRRGRLRRGPERPEGHRGLSGQRGRRWQLR